MYILDSDTIIYLFKNNLQIVEALAATKDPVVTTSINQAELFFGAYRSSRQKDNLKRLEAFFSDIKVLVFDTSASKIFGEYKANLSTKGTIIADCDLMIACIALAHNGTVVTNNIKHFAKIPNLQYINWLH